MAHNEHVDRVVRERWGDWDSFERAVRRLADDARANNYIVGGRAFTAKLLGMSTQENTRDYTYALQALQMVLNRMTDEEIARTGDPNLNVRRLPETPPPVDNAEPRRAPGRSSEHSRENKNSIVTKEMMRDAAWREDLEKRRLGGEERYREKIL